jgi:hypothetical protein
MWRSICVPARRPDGIWRSTRDLPGQPVRFEWTRNSWACQHTEQTQTDLILSVTLSYCDLCYARLVSLHCVYGQFELVWKGFTAELA